ncbi:hypothetical protein SAMN04487948_10162 [Halogranum amylolyticum]|uniref:DUF7344 domain-containing protein n=1 Tax=Halogranum amylolyticum TaxID=660520 RepID=A0A1H8MSI4_9EURY|nr:hypothetical protein [Halogranum amylolyticum]SEO20307.1 hypothetical protein SAMN04487948_10162 [Halogranum amylolyticum]
MPSPFQSLSGAAPDSLERTDLYDALSSERRQIALEHLHSHIGPLSVQDLAAYVASVETGESPPPKDDQRSVHIALHQTHLPKLDQLGLLEYDQDAGVVRPLYTDDVTAYLEVVPDEEFSWGEYYLGLAILALTVQLVGWVSGPAVTFLSAGSVTTALLLLIAGSALYQILTQRRLIRGEKQPHQ